jgi:hypothetical protein
MNQQQRGIIQEDYEHSSQEPLNSVSLVEMMIAPMNPIINTF